jgi:hypothetical protein
MMKKQMMYGAAVMLSWSLVACKGKGGGSVLRKAAIEP